MRQRRNKRLSLDALDGTPRSEHPPDLWRAEVVKNAVKLLVQFHITVEPEINPRKIRALSAAFEDEFLRLESNVFKNQAGEATWEDCRRISLGLARIFKAQAEEILER